MTRILTHIQVPSPDFCHKVGQALLRPASYVFGRSYQGMQEAPVASLSKRVMVAALAVLLFPITLTAAALGALLLSYSVTHKTAYEDAKVTITWTDGKPEIRTRQVVLRPIQPEDLPVYRELFSNATTMARFLGGPRDITNRFNIWLNRWKEHPFSALAVVDPEAKRVFGHVVVGHGDYEGNLDRGWSEGAIVLDPAYWNADHADGIKGTAGKKHIGTQVVRCMLAYVRALKERGVPVPADVTPEQRPQFEEGVKAKTLKVHRDAAGQIDWVYLPFTQVRATARRDNSSHKILTQIVKQNNGTVTPKTPERDLFVMNL